MMTKKTDAELEQMFGVTSKQLDEWEKNAAAGILPGEPIGEIVIGRPLIFGEALKIVAFKETEKKIAAIDRRALSLGCSRSDYLRSLVDRDLATV